MIMRRGVGPVQVGLVASDSAATPSKTAFRVPGESSQASDTVESFSKFVDDKEWEKAFRVLETLDAMKPAPMIRREDGFVVPCDIQIRQMLLSLPADGKKAYRVFYDEKARAILAGNVAAGGVADNPTDNLAKLREVYQRYLISSVGPAAADSLGDAYFERGEFSRAARCWRDVVAYCADADISLPRLTVKQAVALARDGDWARFDDVVARLKSRDGDAKVLIGGREVRAGAYLDELSKSSGRAVAAVEKSAPVPSGGAGPSLPEQDSPQWRYEFMGDDRRLLVNNAMRNRGFNNALNSPVGAAIANEKSIYLSWMSLTVALDSETGKLRWQSAKFEDIVPRLQQMAYGGMRQPCMALAGNHLIVTSVDTNRSPYTNLTSYAADTGRLEWSTIGDGSSGALIFVGNFIVDGSTLYATALGQERSELFLVAMDPSNGSRKWDLMLGTPTPNLRGGVAFDIEPRLASRDGALAVMTNDGTLVMVDPAERRVRWSFVYGGGRPMSNNNRYLSASAGRGVDVVLDRGLVLLKDRTATEAYALDVEDASLRWKRETPSSNDVIVGFSDGNVYLRGESLALYSTRAFEPVWSSSHFGDGAVFPEVTGDRVYVTGSRGLFEIDKKTGKVVSMLTEFEKGSPAGSVLVLGDTIFTLTDSTLTAYRKRIAK